MRHTLAVLLALVLAVAPAYAVYSLSERGEWPKSWPRELEPLRKQSRTLIGPTAAYRHYAISFTKRQEFESALPHILKVKTKGSPIFLSRSPNFFLGGNVKVGVVVHCPALDAAGNLCVPEVPIQGAANARERWANTTWIELVGDGQVIDVKRLHLPADTPIIDERGKAEKPK